MQVDLTTLPTRMLSLPRDHDRGDIPVPYFVAWIPQCSGCSTPTRDKEQEHPGICVCGGAIYDKPDFRVMDPKKWVRAVRDKLCWVCGHPLGKFMTFTVGPMCGINRTSSEPPSHRECAEWSARNCPFLSRPHMHRREGGLPESYVAPAGFMLDRNPGVTLLWTTTRYTVFRSTAGASGWLVEFGDPESVQWLSGARPATRAEVEASVNSGLPTLEATCEQDKDPADSRRLLQQCHAQLVQLYPEG